MLNGSNEGRVRDIVIVGGGTAGWMAAAALSKVLTRDYSIRVVESEEIGTVGVGEATIPMIKLFNNALEIDENDFMRSTKGSFKLGIEFRDWGRIGDSYIHAFGKIGQDLGMVAFYQYWLKMHQAGKAAPLAHTGFDQADIDEYNAHCDFEYDKIRDFLVLHYNATQRDDTPFWNHCRTMEVPEGLRRKVELFRSNGRVFRENKEMFAEMSWVQVMLGQGIQPRGYHALADVYSEEKIAAYLDNVRGVIGNCVQAMPTHDAFIARHCAFAAETVAA
jgi:hypothetical protein